MGRGVGVGALTRDGFFLPRGPDKRRPQGAGGVGADALPGPPGVFGGHDLGCCLRFKANQGISLLNETGGISLLKWRSGVFKKGF